MAGCRGRAAVLPEWLANTLAEELGGRVAQRVQSTLFNFKKNQHVSGRQKLLVYVYTHTDLAKSILDKFECLT